VNLSLSFSQSLKKMEPSAKYDYYPLASTSSTRPSVSLLQLATNVITDWMPGVPNSLASGFSELLDEMLKAETIDADQLWTVRQRMTGFEKQWKQVTSWILGVAFARKIIEDLGYPWWAPVSAFSSKRRTTHTPDWTFYLPPSLCRIERNNSCKLFPDYVLARTKLSALGYEISFAESKGCTDSLENRTVPPSDWKLQSTNARFTFGNVLQLITQYLLIATRVYPAGQRERTRRILVRTWNDHVPGAEVTLDVFQNVVIAHYFGVCERSGLTANAQLLALRNYFPKEDNNQVRRRLELVKAKLLGAANQELHREQIGATSVVFGPASTFKVGEMTIRVGLAEPAANILQSLQFPERNVLERLLHTFDSQIAATRESLRSLDDVFVRADGVVGMLVKRSSE
jgi:hypothetical protein